MPTPTFTTSKEITHVHEINTRTPDWFDWLTVVLPVIVTLITFGLAYKLNSLFENRKEEKRLKDVKEYFLALTKQLADTLNVQSTEIGEAAKRLVGMYEDNAKANLYIDLNTNRIKTIAELDLYKIFISNNKNSIKDNIHTMSLLSATIDSIDEIKLTVNNINKKIVDDANYYSDKYNTLIDNLAIEDIRILKEKDKLTNLLAVQEFVKLHNIYAECLNTYRKKADADTFAVDIIAKNYYYFILPIHNQTRDIAQNELTYETLKHISALMKDYELHQNTVVISATELGGMAADCKKTSLTLESIYQYFE